MNLPIIPKHEQGKRENHQQYGASDIHSCLIIKKELNYYKGECWLKLCCRCQSKSAVVLFNLEVYSNWRKRLVLKTSRSVAISRVSSSLTTSASCILRGRKTDYVVKIQKRKR